MNIKEKIAYLRGLADGMNIKATDEGKLFSAIIETLDDMADEIEELTENALDIGEELDVLSDDLADVEDFLDEIDLDDDWDDYDDSDFYDDDDDDEYACCGVCGGTDFSLDVNCPECGASIELDENDIENESVTCPSCGKDIDLQIDIVDADDEEDDK